MTNPARRLRSEAGDVGTWKPMTDVLHLFEERQLTTQARDRIGAALADAGLESEPPVATAQRWQLLHLFPRGGLRAGHATTNGSSPTATPASRSGATPCSISVAS